MARTLHRLSVLEIRSAKKKPPHRLADGGGLYLRITKTETADAPGSASWMFMTAKGGKREEIGLGSESAIKLADVRRTAAQMRQAIIDGRNPREALEGPVAAPEVRDNSFGAYALTYLERVEEGWKSDVHRAQWRSTLETYAKPIWARPIDSIGTPDVLDILRPIWLTKMETASRVRGRIEKVLAAAKAEGLRPIDANNPAQWKNHLEVLLPRQPKLARGHHGALHHADAPTFVSQLRSRKALAARLLEFIILTAARSGEALGATWSEIDLDKRIWTVPKDRMKAGKEHVVPLSDPAVALLTALETTRNPVDIIFAVGGAARSNMACNMLLRRMGHGEITTHGFRSTFRDWAGDETTHAREVIEQALAHTISNKAEAAYRRGTALEKRRVLMQEWAVFVGQEPAKMAAPEAIGTKSPAASTTRKDEKSPLQASLFI